jgi:hypothetical protein
MIGGHWDLFETFQLVRKIQFMKNIGCYYSDWLLRGAM